MKKTLKILTCITLIFTLALPLAACSQTQPPSDTTKAPDGSPPTQEKPLVLADIGWDSIRLHNAVVGHIMEEIYGLEWEETIVSTPIGWQALQSGEISIYTETWSENLPYYQDDLAKGDIVELGVNFDDNAQGIYVPYYVVHGDSERGIEPMAPDLKNIKDLLKYPELFKDPEEPSKGRIYGAITGWEIDNILRKKFEAYGFADTFNYFSPGTDAALAASIAAAYEKGEPWAGYYWEPTWVSGKYKLILLEDEPYEPEGYAEGLTAFVSNRVTVCVHKSVKEQYPELCEFLSKYSSTSQMIAEALAYMQDTEADYPETAKWYISKNFDLISGFIPADKVEALRASIA